ncbi:hypothetical protein A3K48_07395 [candidate division WOR-1 bacterium RIFOXYA12_FULL_52_29]|uniref:Uncharacterized protein n=1 Tax=candidate division WOR-1 bacterium RIFOXYC12_FULL_54_18 TaxID=1802584 RepID=A0A1F4T7R5_UNCSA|nr:MAG: hypothetical protein A3K44_07395 [candidate division WOR-1 bacterium RIFOXYA2_FULL_51_19]OGC18337.1 MAG: hypothetical protein A3K48_07395 [candidate division WOR-1 bacterium RIFOXYA12_FULL_52_29]OGC27192.1 MAG: hypothetical protein A3K32_07390 [candidate division WOR-1 bacterium RIFOXYB2_FULL_45_9]OGC28754.1 MAG: hypothetical protein A3K49_07395 [candidate division WOR-1 bacterium RIFOXYC12_FULL_54_18]OGC30791.1 MAG: hypothetical protein A2346_05225 [candidate division WOR-1 bacterium R
MINMLRWYWKTWWQVMARPIYFYVKLKEESWKEKAYSFFLVSAWLVAFAMTAAVFFFQYLPIGATLIEGISGYKLLVIMPVMLTLAFVFFLITFFILAGLLVVSLTAAFFALAYLLHYIYLVLGGRGNVERALQAVFYGSAFIVGAWLIVIIAFLTHFGFLSFELFRVGFNFIFVLLIVYAYGLLAVIGRRVYGVPKWKAFAGALVPFFLLLIFAFAFDKIGMERLKSWITPLK